MTEIVGENLFDTNIQQVSEDMYNDPSNAGEKWDDLFYQAYKRGLGLLCIWKQDYGAHLEYSKYSLSLSSLTISSCFSIFFRATFKYGFLLKSSMLFTSAHCNTSCLFLLSKAFLIYWNWTCLLYVCHSGYVARNSGSYSPCSMASVKVILGRDLTLVFFSFDFVFLFPICYFSHKLTKIHSKFYRYHKYTLLIYNPITRHCNHEQ